MEIIIHGKPNAGSSKSTSPNDVLSQKIVEDFFNRRDEIVDQEALIVDARNWSGAWYSVYTYRLFNLKELSENVGRSTYFAVSLIIPNGYCCLVSEVFSMLRKVYNESILGTYISSKGKYIVQNFDDTIAFENVVKTINDNYANLVEYFDSKFVPQSSFNNDKRYSILDCDSKSFIQCLRSTGRIIVTETEKSKDELLAKTNDYIRQLNQAKTELAEKDKRIDKMAKDIDHLEKDLSEANSSIKRKVKQLQNDIETLKNENRILQEEKVSLNGLYDGVKEKIKKVADVLELSKSQGSFLGDSPTVNKDSHIKLSKCNGNGWYDVVPILNTFLILILILILLLNFKGCSNIGEYANISNSELQEEIESLELVLAQKESEIQSLRYHFGQSDNSYTQESQLLDEDCQITFYQNNRPVDANEIDLNQELTIVVGKPMEGYQFYSDNLKNANQLKASTSFILEPEDKSKPIIISYRSAIQKNTNPKNKFEFK